MTKSLFKKLFEGRNPVPIVQIKGPGVSGTQKTIRKRLDFTTISSNNCACVLTKQELSARPSVPYTPVSTGGLQSRLPCEETAREQSPDCHHREIGSGSSLTSSQALLSILRALLNTRSRCLSCQLPSQRTCQKSRERGSLTPGVSALLTFLQTTERCRSQEAQRFHTKGSPHILRNLLTKKLAQGGSCWETTRKTPKFVGSSRVSRFTEN